MKLIMRQIMLAKIRQLDVDSIIDISRIIEILLYKYNFSITEILKVASKVAQLKWSSIFPKNKLNDRHGNKKIINAYIFKKKINNNKKQQQPV